MKASINTLNLSVSSEERKGERDIGNKSTKKQYAEHNNVD